jgi:hypothetical protein
MINPVVFSSNWELLNRHFRHNCDAEIMRIYYEYLSPRMTTEEFVQAIEQVLVDENYFPPAVTIAEKAHGSSQAVAAKEWEVITEAAKQGKAPELCSVAQKALDSIGGRYLIERADIYREMSHLRRQFIDAFHTYQEIEHRRELDSYRQRAEKMLEGGQDATN